MIEVTRELARFAVQFPAGDVPVAARHETTRAFMHWIGCALGGCRQDAIARALDAVRPFFGPAQASLLGRTERADALHAALLNGMSSNVLGFNDTHLDTVIHPTECVAAALLALAEWRPVDGAAFLHALAIGIEVECRIGRAIYPDHYEAGWHITGTAGIFGAAAAAGRLLGLDEQRMAWALGIAATQAAGLRDTFGTMSKCLNPGRAAQNGLAAACLARAGFTSSECALEAPRGFAHVLSTKQDFGAITGGLGERFEIMQNTYKPYPSGIVIHPSIEACLRLHDAHRIDSGRITRVALRVHPLVLELTGRRDPGNTLEAKLSVFHSAAAALMFGKLAEREYADPVVRDPALIRLRDRIEAAPDAEVAKDEAHATVWIDGAEPCSVHVEHATGSRTRPMSDGDLERKFRGLADAVLTPCEITTLIDKCWTLATLADAGGIARAAVPAAA